MASSSSLSCNSKYDVFVSFRGVDVRRGFLSHVLKELKSKGILAFIDNEIKRGESVGLELIGAIRQSKVAIVLLSRNYVTSSWCLDELVEIMKCREEVGQTVVTIFYEVDPSDVRKQTGNFGKAFDETCVGKTEEVKQAWREALRVVAGIAGYHFSSCDNEAEMINKVVSDVMVVLFLTPSRDFDEFVGIGAQITKIKYLLSLQSEEVKVLGILGPAGIGKTTIATVLYNQLSPGFSFSTFLENIKGSYEKPCGNDYLLKLRLQKNLLSQLLNQKDIVVGHLGVAQQMVSGKKVLVVLDEVDSWWQLEELAKQRGWVGSGSIIIITTEDRNLLNKLRLGIDHIYKMKFPTEDEALGIFCKYAFDQKTPDKGFERLAREVTWLAGDLPLALRVMGSYLRGRSRDEWTDALPRLRSSLNREIESTLRFSYDGLIEKDKVLFLHIACFFDNFKVERFITFLEKSGLEVNHGIQVLAEKSLISIDYGSIRMHPLLQKMGREIVEKQSLEEPGKRQFLLDATEISDVLEENTGTGNVLGIKLHFSERKIQISKSSFDGMNNLQFLEVYSSRLYIPEGLNCLPDKLRLIDWRECPLRFWPSKFSGKFLVELIMQYSEFEKLWEGIQPLQCLKLMDLSESQYLKEIPDLSKATNLEKLDLSGCESLLELTSFIGNATKLRVCNLCSCSLLQELPSSIGRLVSLEELDLGYCFSLKAFSGCSSLKEPHLRNTAIEKMPSSISTCSSLYKLDMSGCSNLKEFPNVPDSIVELLLMCTEIEEIPPWIEKLFRLRKLVMSGCKKLKKISPNISKLENLEYLSLGLKDYSEQDISLEIINFYLCRPFFEATINWGSGLRRIWRLRSDFDIDYIFPICLPEKAYRSPRSLRFRGYCLKTIPNCIGRLSGLRTLDVSYCKELVALPPLPGSLLSIDAQGCESLKRIDSSSFQNTNICLNFTSCYNLNQKARKLIQTSACKYAFLPGEEVPAYFHHRHSSRSLTINLTPTTPLPSSFRFKACIMMSHKKIYSESDSDDDREDIVDISDDEAHVIPPSRVSCRVSGKQNGLTVRYGPIQLPPKLYVCTISRYLYIFEGSVSLYEDCPEAEEVTFSELCFKFRVDNNSMKVKGCGVRLLEGVPQCITYDDDKDENDDDGDDDDDEDESDDDGEGSRRGMFCFNHRKRKKLGKSDTKKRVLKRLT